MKLRRIWAGITLMLVPVLFLISVFPLGVLLGSFGMDVHWNGSRTLLHVFEIGAISILLGSIATGVWLYRTGVKAIPYR